MAATRLGVDTDSSKMIAPHLPAQQRALALNAAFPHLKSSIAVVVRSGNGDAADAVATELVERLSERDDVIESVFAPSVAPFLMAHGFLYRSTEEVDSNFTRLVKSANLLARLRADQTVETFFDALNEAATLTERAEISADALDRLYAETATVLEARTAEKSHGFAWSSVLEQESDLDRVTRIISVRPLLDPSRLSPAKPALQALEEVIAALPEEIKRPVRIGVTGEPALRGQELQSVIGSIGISLALSLVLVGVILAVGLKSIGQAGLALGSLLISLVITTGFAALAVGALNLVSVAFIVLMVGLGIDFAIHVLAHIAEQRRHGSPADAAVGLTGQRTGLALALSAVTTSLAFIAFAVTDFDGMTQLGLIGAAGVLIAFTVAITFIPAALGVWPKIAGCPASVEPQVASARARLRPAFPMIVIAAGLAAVLPASQARFDADPMGLRDQDAPSVRAFRSLAETPETTPYRASVLASSIIEASEIAESFKGQKFIGEALSINDLIPKDQERKLDLLDFAYPSIAHAVSGTATELVSKVKGGPDSMSRLVQRLDGGDDTAGRLREALSAYRSIRTEETDGALEADLFRYFPMLITRLGLMLESDFVDAGTLPQELRQRYVSDNGVYRVEVLPQEDVGFPAALERFVTAAAEINPEVAGGPVQLYAAAETVSGAIMMAVGFAALATLALAIFATRRLSETLAILVPLIFAGVMTAGASVLLDMPFNYANVIVLPLLIGIGIDSGIHIALRERRAPGAVFSTSTPRAVIISALTTMAAFGTLALSDHRGTASMGALLAIAMLASICSVLALTPSIIRWLQRH
jgi:hopanoid biosynthesis associated RND transporter like protein HpnN